MKTNPHCVFLLGGYDLEMLTIKQMLEERDGYIVLDKQLRWDNSLLSAYRNELDYYTESEIFGIELREDIPIPINYHRIDHHNDWTDKPSSLEQVAEFLGVKLTHYQQLVAANDKGYIPALKVLGVSKEEIDDIRRKDRAAQGILEDDEALAEKAIAENLHIYKGLTVVKAFSSCFSPICDRMYSCQRLLIYTDSDWMFYGEGTVELVSLLSKDIRQKKVFYGGGDNGYIGTMQHAFSKEQIERFVNYLIQKYEYI